MFVNICNECEYEWHYKTFWSQPSFSGEGWLLKAWWMSSHKRLKLESTAIILPIIVFFVLLLSCDGGWGSCCSGWFWNFLILFFLVFFFCWFFELTMSRGIITYAGHLQLLSKLRCNNLDRFYLFLDHLNGWHLETHLVLDVLWQILLCNQNDGGPAWDIQLDKVWSLLVLLSFGHVSFGVSRSQSIMATQLILVRVESNDVVWVPKCSNLVVLERLVGVEVEHKQKSSLLEDNQLIFLMSKSYKLVLTCHCLQGVFPLIHHFLKLE